MITVFVLIKAKQGKMRIAGKALEEYEEITEVNEVLGSHDIIAKGLFSDFEELKKFIQNKLQITEGIKETETLLVLRKSE